MYNPLAKDQIGANATAFLTGRQAYKNGATFWQSVEVGLAWRWFYANLVFSLFPLVFSLVFTPVFPWYGPLQVLTHLFVFGVTYVNLVDCSPGFKLRWWYRRWHKIAHAFPNVSRMWWYTLILFPSWSVMFIGRIGQPWINEGPWGAQ